MKRLAVAVAAMMFANPAHANDWEKFFQSTSTPDSVLPSSVDPEVIPSSGNIDQDFEQMWRKGFAPIGYTSFSTNNGKTKDALRFAKKLKARYVMVSANITSSNTVSVPLTTPNVTTSYTSGNASAYGRGGQVTGTYSGTTTTYGSQTSYIPLTFERYNKTAIYFAEAPKSGTGLKVRPLTSQEASAVETNRAIVVQFVRDGSPAYMADILPGDLITQVNGNPVDFETWKAAAQGAEPMKVHLLRKGQPRDLIITVPPEWRPK